MTYTYTKVCYKVFYKVVDVSSIAGNVDVDDSYSYINIRSFIRSSTFPALLETSTTLDAGFVNR